ncbi:IclR family transcriptional regulator [Pseudomonas sp. WHRI 8519]|uniref:IclR family transcriptional regulator n=1 Tax=Pseudomonas sp. WHRI 8519 TaxID=3162567 RepID=UPI0032EFD064
MDSPTAKAFKLIELFRDRSEVRFSDLVAQLGMSRTAAHRLLATLEEQRLLHRAVGGFELGPRLHQLATQSISAALSSGGIRMILTELCKTTGESCGLSILKTGEVEYVNTITAGARLTSMFQPGHRGPLHCTSSGRVFLASMAQVDIEHFYASAPWTRFTDQTVCDARQLRRVIENTRRQGFAVTGAEFTLGLVGGAVPVYTPSGAIMACLNIFAPQVRRTEQDIQGFVPVLKAASARITDYFTSI